MGDILPAETEAKYRTGNESTVPEWIVNEAHLINESLDKGKVLLDQAEHGLTTEGEIFEMMQSLVPDYVQATYFVEYPPETVRPEDRGRELLRLFQQEIPAERGGGDLADYLARRGESISLAMITLDESTADAVKYLLARGVPVVGWVVVPDEQGYWTNALNIAETAAKTREIQEWMQRYGVSMPVLGFDLENPLEVVGAPDRMKAAGDKVGVAIVKLVRMMFGYVRQIIAAGGHKRAERDFNALLTELRAKGFTLEAYVFPPLAHVLSSSLRRPGRKSGVKNVEMRYVPSILPIHDRSAVPALGIVSEVEGQTPGRVFAEGMLPHHLTQEELTEQIERLFAEGAITPDIDLKNRTISKKQMYLFALNNFRIATRLRRAVEDAWTRVKPATE